MHQAPLKPVERPQALVDQVYAALREQLRGGAITAGAALQEVPLAAQLGVSRTPVREALTRLASEGLLASDRRSYTVPSLTRQDVDDIYEVRALVEPAAMRRVAALTRDPQVRAALDTALADAAEAHRKGSAEGFRDAHLRHRMAWMALLPNPRLLRIVELYGDHLQHIRTLTLDDARVRRIVLKGLERITAALAAGDGEAAAKATLEHLDNARAAFIEATGLAAPPAPRRRKKGE